MGFVLLSVALVLACVSTTCRSQTTVACSPAPVLGALSYAFGPGVGDNGALVNGTETTFTVATGLEDCCCAPTPCLDLARVRVSIVGPDGQPVGFRFVAPCVNGEYALAWTPCQGGFFVVTVAIDAQNVRNTPATVLVTGPGRTTYKLGDDPAASSAFDFNGLLRGA